MALKEHIERLFHNFPYKRPHLDSALSGLQESRLFMSSPNEKPAGAIHHSAGFMLLAGDPECGGVWRFLEEQLDRNCWGRGIVALVPGSEDWELAIAERYATAQPNPRIFLERSAGVSEQEQSDFRINDRNVEVVDLISTPKRERDSVLERAIELNWGTVNHFLQHGIGFLILRGGEPVSICFAVTIGDSSAPIQINTHKGRRRSGYACLGAMAYIEACVKSGISAAWECDETNEPSKQLAAKLGFVEVYRFTSYLCVGQGHLDL